MPTSTTSNNSNKEISDENIPAPLAAEVADVADSDDSLASKNRQSRLKSLSKRGAIAVAFFALVCSSNIFFFEYNLGELIADSEAAEEYFNKAVNKPVEKIILLGERHSGTNWITDHLTECFQNDHLEVTNHYKRFKHWFQEEYLEKVPENSAVVVAMFRDPYTWVEAMRVEPHHAHNHLIMPKKKYDPNQGWYEQGGRPLGWKDFVTKPWIGKTMRGPADINITEIPGGKERALCINDYSFVEQSPCSQDDTSWLRGLGDNFYELQHDGSERAYSSVINLRRDKIINHLSVADFLGTRAFFPFRYEDMNANGTSALLRSLEDATGLKANCSAIVGGNYTMIAKGRRRLEKKPITKHRELPVEFIKWMNEFVDWEIESRIGYVKRELQ